MSTLTIVGAGGHAKVVIATAQARGWTIGAVVDDDRSRWGQTLLGCTISGPSEPELANPDATCVIAIGNNVRRRELALTARCRFATLIHPSAWVHDSVEVGAGSVVLAGAVVQPDARVGAHVIVNTGAGVDHDCRIGDFVHVAPGAHLAGGVQVGEGAVVGVGAAVVSGMRIGARGTVPPGAAVVSDVPEITLEKLSDLQYKNPPSR